MDKKEKKQLYMKEWRSKNRLRILEYKASKGKVQNAEYRERHREKLREKSRDYYIKNKRDIAERTKKIRLSDPERFAGYAARSYRANKERHKRNMLAYRAANPDREKQTGAAWKRVNAHKVRAYGMKRIAAKRMAIPIWADLEAIEDVYKEAEYMGLEVDHIIPLQSPIVCGLHVWDNLQLLTKKENILKGNRVWPDMPMAE